MTDGRATFTILFVCTGNVCRSPFAEMFTRHLLDERLSPHDAARFVTRSAGSHALTDGCLHPFTHYELRRWGADRAISSAHVPRQLDREAMRSADLVLTAERRHRAHAVLLFPPALRKAFCLREFERLLALTEPPGAPCDPADRAATIVAEAARWRCMIPAVDEADDAVPDPFGKGPQTHEYSAMMIATLVDKIVNRIVAT